MKCKKKKLKIKISVIVSAVDTNLTVDYVIVFNDVQFTPNNTLNDRCQSIMDLFYEELTKVT